MSDQEQPQRRPSYNAASLSAKIDEIELISREALEIARSSYQRAKDMERQVSDMATQVEDLDTLLHGHPEERRRDQEPGLVAKVNVVHADYRNRKAVRNSLWALASLLGALNVTQLLIIMLSRGG